MSTIHEQPEWRLRTHEEFAQFFTSKLAPCLRACEQDRRRSARNAIIVIAVTLVIAIGLAALLLSSGGQPMLLLFVAILAGAVMTMGVSIAKSGFRRRFKQNLVSQVVLFFGPDFEYDPDSCIPQERFRQSRIFEHRIDRYRGEDYISGVAGRTLFQCSEIHAEYKTTSTDSKGRRRTHWHTIFKGLYFIADFHKHFSGTTLVLPDVAQSTLGWFGQKLQEMNFSRPGDLVKLEDPEFEKLFVVYSTDQVEARYILSPSLMHRLVEFRRKVGRAIHLSFKDECVFVAADPGRNLLEPPLFSPISAQTCAAAFADLRFVLGIIEELNLNTRIWTKQ